MEGGRNVRRAKVGLVAGGMVIALALASCSGVSAVSPSSMPSTVSTARSTSLPVEATGAAADLRRICDKDCVALQSASADDCTNDSSRCSLTEANLSFLFDRFEADVTSSSVDVAAYPNLKVAIDFAQGALDSYSLGCGGAGSSPQCTIQVSTLAQNIVAVGYGLQVAAGH